MVYFTSIADGRYVDLLEVQVSIAVLSRDGPAEGQDDVFVRFVQSEISCGTTGLDPTRPIRYLFFSLLLICKRDVGTYSSNPSMI